MFRAAFKKSRVLVPVDAFYEWQVVAGGKRPYLIQLALFESRFCGQNGAAQCLGIVQGMVFSESRGGLK